MNRLKQLRKICGTTQEELARKIGIEQSNYCNIENGILIPRNIEEIKIKAFEILKPRLLDVIKDKEKELKTLTDFLIDAGMKCK